MIIEEDLKKRSKEIVWPKGFTPDDADMFAHNELRIVAPAEMIWHCLLDVQSWPDWYSNAGRIRIVDGLVNGALGMGTVFQWKTFGKTYQCKVMELVPNTRIGWLGWPVGGEPTNYHAWLIKLEGDSCFIEAEEVGKGEAAVKVRRTDEGFFHRGHDLWLSSLRFAVEGQPK